MSDNLDYYGEVNLNDPEIKAWDGAGGVLPPGEYEFEITKYEKKETKKGLPRLALTLKVVSQGEQNGRTSYHSFMLAGDKDTWKSRLKHIVQVLGITPDARGGFNFAALMGKRFIAVVVVGTFDDTDPTTGMKVEKPSSSIEKERSATGGNPPMGMFANGTMTGAVSVSGPRA